MTECDGATECDTHATVAQCDGATQPIGLSQSSRRTSDQESATPGREGLSLDSMRQAYEQGGRRGHHQRAREAKRVEASGEPYREAEAQGQLALDFGEGTT